MTILELMAEVKARKARVDKLASQAPVSMEFNTRDGRALVVSGDPSKKGRWRVTSLDSTGEPTGHCEAPDFGAAVRLAADMGARI